MIRLLHAMRMPIVLAILALMISSVAAGPVPLIFDTDMGNDIDDALALGLIHAFQRRGDCRLIAVTLTNDHRYAAPFVDLVNTFYGYGDVPIGVVRGGVTHGDGNYLRELACAEDNGQPRYPHKLREGSQAAEATAVLRRALAAQADGSVVIVQVGFSTNLARLLDSKPDVLSPLDGKALVRRKVRLLSAMAGNFAPRPGERFKEFNVMTDVASAKKVFQQWPTPIVVSGFEVGNAILYPHRSIEQDYRYVPHHPLAEAYKLYMKMPYDRPTWDLTSTLYAIRSDKASFGLSRPGRVVVEDDGVTRFQPEEGGLHRYLTIVSREQALRVRDAFADLCSEPPAAVIERQKQDAAADQRRKVRSTRTTPETRVQLENQALRLDFDPRTSGTDYNYIWVRRPGGNRWERVHNFGVDVGSYDSGDQREMNCIGINLSLERIGRTMKVTYPSPLVQYRQFDDRIGTPALSASIRTSRPTRPAAWFMPTPRSSSATRSTPNGRASWCRGGCSGGGSAQSFTSLTPCGPTTTSCPPTSWSRGRLNSIPLSPTGKKPVRRWRSKRCTTQFSTAATARGSRLRCCRWCPIGPASATTSTTGSVFTTSTRRS